MKIKLRITFLKAPRWKRTQFLDTILISLIYYNR